MSENNDEIKLYDPKFLEKVEKALKDFSDDEIDNLLEPASISESMISARFTIKEKGITTNYWIHGRIKVTCQGFRAKYDYEGYLTCDAPDGPRANADEIDLHIIRDKDGANYKHSCKNTSWCPKTDRITAFPTACGHTRMRACAKVGSASGCTNWINV